MLALSLLALAALGEGEKPEGSRGQTRGGGGRLGDAEELRAAIPVRKIGASAATEDWRERSNPSSTPSP